MKRFLFVTTVFCTLVIISQSGCYYDKEDLLYHQSSVTDCGSTPARFSTDVLPIMEKKCALSGCHNHSSAAGGVALETYAEISAKAARINQRCVVEKSMPLGSTLSSSEIASLKCWISSGAPNN